MAAPNSVDDLERAFLLPYVEAIVPGANLLSLADLRYKFYLGIAEGTIVIGGGGGGGSAPVASAIHNFGSSTGNIASGGISYTRIGNTVVATYDVSFLSQQPAGLLHLGAAPVGYTPINDAFGFVTSEGNSFLGKYAPGGTSVELTTSVPGEEVIRGSVTYFTSDAFPV